MNRQLICVIGVISFTTLVTSSCQTSRDPEIQSVTTSVNVASCAKAVDKDDPDEIPYLSCPGVAGYTLNIRQVESGRTSIDLVNAGHRTFPLRYEDVVTRSMSNLADKAEWRVATKNGKQEPIALIVPVHAHEELEDPAKVTHTYLAIAKITPDSVCVTDKIAEGTRTLAEVRALADSSQSRSCAPDLPQPTP